MWNQLEVFEAVSGRWWKAGGKGEFLVDSRNKGTKGKITEQSQRGCGTSQRAQCEYGRVEKPQILSSWNDG